MDGYDVLNVKSAVKSRNHYKWDRRHLTTSDFGQIMLPFNEELVPGDDLNHVKGNFFARLAPLVKPTYGKVDFRTAAFFVPYHQVAEDIDAWFAGASNWYSITPSLRGVTAYALFNFAVQVSSVSSSSNYDFCYLSSSGTPVYRSFTSVGRYYVKILHSLGYCIPSKVDEQSSSYWSTTGSKVRYSALPLLAFFKAYNDWMSQSQRYNISQLSSLLLKIRQNKNASPLYDSSTCNLSYQGLVLMFGELKLNYENDYFTSAWQNANMPLSQYPGQTPVVPVSSLGTVTPTLQANSDFTEMNVGVDGTLQRATIPALGLQFLKSFDDWVRRNNYSGSRQVQQIYSRFGIKTDDYRTHFAHLIKTTSAPLMVGDVMASADTQSSGSSDGVPLGDYAGKGIISDDCDYSYKSSDYGLFMVFSWIAVKPMNAYGFDRKVLRTSPFDFYNPEFDGIGADPISYDEVFVDNKTLPSADSSRGDLVFGFTERYNAYRSGYRDQITGDFRYYDDMDVWHLGRDLSALRSSVTLVAQSDSMNTLAQADSEYDRIFGTVTNDSPDHFYFTCKFDVDCVRPMMNFNEVVRLGVGNTSVPRNGNTVN